MADDAFLLGGSHGIERTGFTNDVEVSIAVTDVTTGPDSFAGWARRRVWAEMLELNMNDPLLVDPIAGLQELRRQADQGTKRIRHYYPIDLGRNLSWAEEKAYSIYEPEGRCNKY